MLREWLIVLRAMPMGGQRLLNALHACGGIRQLVAAPAAQLRQLGLAATTVAAIRRPDAARIAADQRWLNQANRHLITWDQPAYPALLRQAPSPPAALFVEGEPALLWQPQLAIVGSRKPTAGGLDHARAFSRAMSRRGFAVTSGLASGIDSAAHAAALDVGGTTLAVMGTGPDRIYPASSTRLAERIVRGGALVSELPPGQPPRKAHFPARNRIIAGLSLGVLVVEAGLGSGSLITARLAAEQGREVFAVPGSLRNPMARGCHRLIRDGAMLVEDPDDMVAELRPVASALAIALGGQLLPEDRERAPGPSWPSSCAEMPDMMADPDYRRLWAVLGHDPKPVDCLVTQSGLRVQAVSSMLLMLELRGQVEVFEGAKYARRNAGVEGGKSAENRG